MRIGDIAGILLMAGMAAQGVAGGVRVTQQAQQNPGDHIVREGTMTGTNTGPLELPEGQLQPTGRSVALPLAFIVAGGIKFSLTNYSPGSGRTRQQRRCCRQGLLEYPVEEQRPLDGPGQI